MDFVVDNAVALSAIFLGVVVLAALGLLGLAGLRLWRRVKAVRRRLGPEGEALSAKAERLQAALAAMPERQAELQGELESLQQRLAALAVLARHASEAIAALRAPIRYFGG